jgi:carbon storage regulator
MLILTRKIGETVIVGNSVRVTIVDLSPGVVRLGFEAPPEVSIHREEVYREIAQVNDEALKKKPPKDNLG